MPVVHAEHHEDHHQRAGQHDQVDDGARYGDAQSAETEDGQDRGQQPCVHPGVVSHGGFS
jgi:hypothetical protein